MNAEPDTYPSEALADEEPRYLRRQKPLEIRRRKFARGSWPTYRNWLLAAAGLITMAAAAYYGTRFFLYSPKVALANYDQIEITGNHYVSRAAIAEKFAADLGRSAMRVPLGARRGSPPPPAANPPKRSPGPQKPLLPALCPAVFAWTLPSGTPSHSCAPPTSW